MGVQNYVVLGFINILVGGFIAYRINRLIPVLKEDSSYTGVMMAMGSIFGITCCIEAVIVANLVNMV